MTQPSRRQGRIAWSYGRAANGERALPVETAVALVFNGSSHAVMMASPADLEDFALGFSLAEGIVDTPQDIQSLEIETNQHGIELRLWLDDAHAERLAARRRQMAGPTGCGLCGIESLEQAMRPPETVDASLRFAPQMITQAMASMAPAQTLNTETRAVHAAGYWEPGQGLVALREDVGRHNALDKLAGALAQRGAAPSRGLLLLTSRVSVEMVQKAARMGAPIIVAVSAPTTLAVQMADAAGITLIAVARGDEFEIFTHAYRVVVEAADHVA